MHELLFPNATRDLLVLLYENKEDPAPAIDEYLKKFAITKAQMFLTSLTSAPDLFPEEDLLERMKERQQ